MQESLVEPQAVMPAIISLLVAFALSLPVAWNRELTRRRMGLRTFPLVAIASCAYVLIGIAIAGENSDSLARIVSGLMTGIGFIGGGAILKSSEEVRGASTAAAIWATGALGAAVALRRFGLAIAIAIMTFLIFLLLTPVRGRIDPDGKMDPDERIDPDG